MKAIACGWQDNLVEYADKEDVLMAIAYIRDNVDLDVHFCPVPCIDAKTGVIKDYGYQPYWRLVEAVRSGKGTWIENNNCKIDENTVLFGDLACVEHFYKEAKQKPRVDLRASFQSSKPSNYADVCLNYDIALDNCVDVSIQNNTDLYLLYKEMVCAKYGFDPKDIAEIEYD